MKNNKMSYQEQIESKCYKESLNFKDVPCNIISLNNHISNKIIKNNTYIRNIDIKQENEMKIIKALLKISEWALKYNYFTNIKKLDGGFKNLVVLITTAKGDTYVAKAFIEGKEKANNQKHAYKTIKKIIKQDEKLIPEIIEWVEDDEIDIVISEKAEGKPLIQILKEVNKDDDSTIYEACNSFYNLGITLAMLHERTERKIDQINIQTRQNAHKLIKHLDMFKDLLNINDEQLNILKNNIYKIINNGFISVVHGDAHLGQFFQAPNKSIITIVDYDSLHEDDPMSDVSRCISSLRYNGYKMNIPNDILIMIEKSFFEGYNKVRIEDAHTNESEFDQLKIICYSIRLHLIQLKTYQELRDKIKSILPKTMSETDFYNAYKNGDIVDIKSYGLNEKEIEQLNDLIYIRNEAMEIIKYLLLINL